MYFIAADTDNNHFEKLLEMAFNSGRKVGAIENCGLPVSNELSMFSSFRNQMEPCEGLGPRDSYGNNNSRFGNDYSFRDQPSRGSYGGMGRSSFGNMNAQRNSFQGNARYNDFNDGDFMEFSNMVNNRLSRFDDELGPDNYGARRTFGNQNNARGMFGRNSYDDGRANYSNPRNNGRYQDNFSGNRFGNQVGL